MKTGYLTYALGRNPSGIGQYSCHLLAAFRDIGFDPLVLCSGGGVENSKSVKLPGAGLLPGLLTFGQVEIGWLSRQKDFDLIHDPTGTAPLYFTDIPRVVTLCDALPLVKPHTSAVLERLIYRYWLPFILPRLDVVITISQQSKSDIIQHLPVKSKDVIVTPLAANASFQPLTSKEIGPSLERHSIETPYLLYVGSIEPRKNLLRLLDAYSRLREWSTKWHLVIVGGRNIWKSTPVGEKVGKLELQDSVHFTGYVPDGDLPALYNGADLFVFPSLYEGFGLPVLEAMACGTPVVTSNTSALPEVAGDAALLVDPYDVDAIANGMQSILADPELAAELRMRGLERAKLFTWEKTARETIKVYERVLGREIIKSA